MHRRSAGGRVRGATTPRGMVEGALAVALLPLMLGALAGPGGAARGDEPLEAADTTVLDGVFTAAQAERGRDIFEVHCMRCHALAEFTAGPHVPTAKWPNVGAMFGTVMVRMPYDDPGSLGQADYAAVVSYLLQQNGYPARDRELPLDVRKLIPIRILPLPETAGS